MKKGRSRVGSVACGLFQSFCSYCSLRDLGFYGPEFTWNQGSLFKRLDKTLCNFEWEEFAPATMVHHLYKLKSDHRPIAISLDNNSSPKVYRPFHFLSGWLSHCEYS